MPRDPEQEVNGVWTVDEAYFDGCVEERKGESSLRLGDVWVKLIENVIRQHGRYVFAQLQIASKNAPNLGPRVHGLRLDHVQACFDAFLAPIGTCGGHGQTSC